MPSKDKSSQLPWPTKLASTAHLKCIKNRATPQHLPSNPNQEAFFITTFKSQTVGLIFVQSCMALAILAVRGGQGSVPETTGDIHCITFTAKRRGCRQIRPRLPHDRRRWQPLPGFHIPPRRRRVTASQPTVAVSKVATLQGMGVQASRVGTPPCNERSSA